MNRFLIFITGLFLMFFSCSYERTYTKYSVKDLSKVVNDTLEVNTPERVNNLEVLIKGTINGRAVLKFENGSGRYNTIELEGLINEVYATEWYDTKCKFIYEPVSKVKGDSLILEYRIY
ncbi:hypothetical protein [Bergeyella sp. RCAD1439]|uniref:hypothetical protein n=1 Tax=Bergeyella anatis TaxID=3113737 RepID=UPI002E16ED77|nr:hypothetical protein [Bergeyella sp. RCAD1439]